ncbi:MAG: hypothetical protein IKI63_00400 [Clostridia bacterium]|nr:hypothetical protein [Clostridia bacterium]
MAANFFKGMGIGTVVGGVTGAVSCVYVMNHKRSLRKNVSKALKNASQLVENFGSMF